MIKIYAVYDMKDNEQCIGIFDTLQEVVDYLEIKNTNVLASAISKQNIIISLIVKFAVMILGVTGLVSSLWLAIGADVGMLILAILNAIRNRGKVY